MSRKFHGQRSLVGYSQCDHKELDTTENTRTHLSPCILSSSVLVTHSCPICNQWTAAHKASLSMGFSRQGYSMVCHLLLQGIFPTQESNLGLLHCRQILYRVSYQGSPSPWPYIKPFFAPNSNLSVCLASLCVRHKIRANTLGSE